MDFSQVRVNCSMIHCIYSPPKDALTTNQLIKIEEYSAKVKPLTDRQREEYMKLLDKRDNHHGLLFSRTAQRYLLFLYRVHRYGRQYTLKGELPPQLMKGLVREKDAMQLISEVYEIPLFRDKRRLKSEYLAGEIDIYDAPTVSESEKVYEIKNAYDLGSFLHIMKAPLSKSAYLQMQGYLSITGKQYGELIYCLTPYTEDVIQQQMDILVSQMCPDGIITEKFERYWEFAERKMRYLDIPPRERVFSILIERDDTVIEKINERVEEARQWLFEHQEYHERAITQRHLDGKKIRI